MKTEFYDGILYQIEFKPELSNGDYTAHTVYHIRTNDENYSHAHMAIQAIMNDGSWTEGEWKMKNKQDPSMENAFHTYHKFSYDEGLDRFVYTLVRPYDD